MAYELLLAKKQAVAHLAPAFSAADSVWAENVQFKEMGTKVELQPAQPGYGVPAGVITAEHTELTFTTLLVGSGTAGTAPSWGFLAKAAGWAEEVDAGSVTYTRAPPSDAADTMAFDWSDMTRHHKALDGRGKTDIKLAANQPPRLDWLFRALLVPLVARTPVVDDDADFSDWPTTRPISFDLTTFTLGGVPMVLRDLTMTGADNVKFVDLPNQKGVFHRGSPAYTGSLKCSTPTLATFNPQTKWINGNLLPFTFTHGKTAGSIVTVNGVVQLNDVAWSREDEDDVFTANISLTTAPSLVLT
ncbi:hypothetical protein [Caulobacter segnis]|uniref:Uncharacterized protein n=1 Tax=Caulobacter segnis TaxID=88688 RepID=A0A2W5V329_9CAUL|nr:hypothetical protein [Caulobacter segnis]PZR32293.1 MAG: hypothetical protein DI526_17110 [Caulobacter segnis]